MKHPLGCRILLLLLTGVAAGAQSGPLIDHMVTASGFGAYPGMAAPGSWVEIYGSNLAGTTREWAAADFSGAVAPTSLDAVSVTVNGTPAYISYVSPSQINMQLPDGLPVGANAVVVKYQSVSSVGAPLVIASQQPGLLAPSSFNVEGKQYVVAIHASSGAFVGNGSVANVAAAPALAGETLVLYGIGFGPVTPSGVGGRVASGLTSLSGSLAISIGGTPATINYAGLAPGVVGLYQFNMVVPAILTTGDLPVVGTLNGIAIPQTLVLPVKAPDPLPGSFTLTSSVGATGGTLPATYTCDGQGSTIPLTWTGAPSGTKEYAVLMTTIPGDGTTKWNWVLYKVPATTTSLPRDSFLAGTLGLGSDGPGTIYNPPCAQGPGAKVYTWTVYALSETPTFSVPASQVTGQMVTDAIAPLKLASATLNLSATRTATTGSSTGCGYIISSVRASKSGTPVVTCDATYAYISSNGITNHPMMNGITSTNLQVPIPVNFNGANAWKIPLNPAIATSPTSVVDGPLGVAINGVPIFNPCTQGGCVTGGDTKVLGQLDTCNGHSGRADDYHYHAAPTCMMADQLTNYWDTHPLGWALDGFPIFGYRDADGSTATRDSICGGNTKSVPNAPAGYAYHVTDASPYVTNCLIGTPSPDLAGQGAKYRPMRQPPVTPFNVSGMTLTTDPGDGYQVLQFTSAIRFTTNETGTDSYVNQPGTYKIRYKQVTGAELAALLALRQNANATTCWSFQFTNNGGDTTQPSISYCK